MRFQNYQYLWWNLRFLYFWRSWVFFKILMKSEFSLDPLCKIHLVWRHWMMYIVIVIDTEGYTQPNIIYIFSLWSYYSNNQIKDISYNNNCERNFIKYFIYIFFIKSDGNIYICFKELTSSLSSSALPPSCCALYRYIESCRFINQHWYIIIWKLVGPWNCI